ncbi:MAG: hypothetical protein RL385_806 [Pseudomonadota bacterium]
MDRRTGAINGLQKTLLFVLLSGCVIWENDFRNASGLCGAKETRGAGDYCNCDSDCASSATDGYCLDEAGWGNPGGECRQFCSYDGDCGGAFACIQQVCWPSCSTTAECAVGRSCLSTDRDGVRVCFAFCDEDSDCNSGRCNLYSNGCIASGAQVQGGGVDAACDVDAQCLSNRCAGGLCETTCDPEFQRCPEGAHCGEDGRCALLCERCDGDSACDIGLPALCTSDASL